MTQKSPRNVAASVHQRLLNIAKAQDRPFAEVLQYYAMERFLYRLSITPYSGSFILKGALFFRVWDVSDSRATRDIDLLGYTNNEPDNLAIVFQELCETEVPDDGLVFDSRSVTALPIKKDAEYRGVRIRFLGYLERAKTPMQIDVGFGDTVHPQARVEVYPTFLEFPSPQLRAYPPETVVAEKVEAMIHLGGLNSRTKDFHDILRMSHLFEFDGAVLGHAIQLTTENRATSIVPFSEIATELLDNEHIDIKWTAFLRKSRLDGPASFEALLNVLTPFLSPLLLSLVDGNVLENHWRPPGPWISNSIS